MSYLLPQAMPLYEGDFGNGFYGCACLLEGDFWPRNGDEIGLIYRDDGAETYDYSLPCGVYDDGDATDSISLQALGTDNTYEYVGRSVSIAGSIGPVSEICFVTTDGSGDHYAVPNEPFNLVGEATTGGTIRLRWQYDPTGQQVAPTGFKVYRDVASIWTYQATETYKVGKSKYSWTSGALSHGTEYDFIVRSYAGSDEEENENSVSVTADSQGPAAISSFTISVV